MKVPGKILKTVGKALTVLFVNKLFSKDLYTLHVSVPRITQGFLGLQTF